jgi:hypothetical protein
MNMTTYEEEAEKKAEGMSDGMKIAALVGTLGLTGLVAYWCRDGGPLGGASKKASGPGRTYLSGGGETAGTLAAKYNAVGHESEIIAANPTIDWTQPLGIGVHVVIPDSWSPLYSTKTSSGPHVNPHVGPYPGGWPYNAKTGQWWNWKATSQGDDYSGWAAQYAAHGPSKLATPDFRHGFQVGMAESKLHQGSPVTANVSTRGGGQQLWNGTAWQTTTPDFQHGWQAGLLAGRHHQGAQKT